MPDPWLVYARPDFWRELKRLPGHKRRAVETFVTTLKTNPRGPRSKLLSQQITTTEVRRWRSDSLRVLYLIDDESRWVALIAIRERPPYDYGDLESLIGES